MDLLKVFYTLPHSCTCLTCLKFISEAQNMRTWLTPLGLMNVLHHVGPHLLITHQSVSVVCKTGAPVKQNVQVACP